MLRHTSGNEIVGTYAPYFQAGRGCETRSQRKYLAYGGTYGLGSHGIVTLAANRCASRPWQRAEIGGMPPDAAPRFPGRRCFVIASAVVAAVSGLIPAVLSSQGAGATTVGSLQARAQAIATQITTVNTKIAVLGEEYDQAKLRVGDLDRAISTDKGALATTKQSMQHAMATLRTGAVAAYVSAGSSSGLSVLMGSNANTLPLQQTYLEAADATISTEATTLIDAEHQLKIRRRTLDQAESSATAAATTVASAENREKVLVGQLMAAQTNVKGKLAAAVARQEVIEQDQAAARAAAERAAAATVRVAAAQPAPPVVAAPVATAPAASAVTSSGSSQGAAAVRAAESQIGVPYVWGGATPGEGFDCSGLAMWAWSQAGVNLPHSAQAQYDSIEHISFNQLQPGDLIFYASGGYIYHVIMYIGGGQAVQAEDTGTNIQITPVWGGAYAAGRP